MIILPYNPGDSYGLSPFIVAALRGASEEELLEYAKGFDLEALFATDRLAERWGAKNGRYVPHRVVHRWLTSFAVYLMNHQWARAYNCLVQLGVGPRAPLPEGWAGPYDELRWCAKHQKEYTAAVKKIIDEQEGAKRNLRTWVAKDKKILRDAGITTLAEYRDSPALRNSKLVCCSPEWLQWCKETLLK